MKDNFFGERLKELRVEKGLSQRKFGELREPDMDTLVRISEFFDVSTDFLLGKKDL